MTGISFANERHGNSKGNLIYLPSSRNVIIQRVTLHELGEYEIPRKPGVGLRHRCGVAQTSLPVGTKQLNR
jgi:hypothetical protein